MSRHIITLYPTNTHLINSLRNALCQRDLAVQQGAQPHIQVTGNRQQLLDCVRATLKDAECSDWSFFIRREDEYYCQKRLVVFDMDATLVVNETLDELAKAVEIDEQVATLTAAAMQGAIDFKTSLTRRVALLAGVSLTHAVRVRDAMQLQSGAIALLNALHDHNIKTALVSGGFDFFARPIATQLGIDYVCVNSLVSAHNTLTGEVVQPIIDGEAKRAFVNQIMTKEQLTADQVCAIGDGANDLLMLEDVGLGVAFCGKPLLRSRIANQLNIPDLAQLIEPICRN